MLIVCVLLHFYHHAQILCFVWNGVNLDTCRFFAGPTRALDDSPVVPFSLQDECLRFGHWQLPKFKAFPLLQSLFSGVATLKIAVPCNNMDCIMYNYVSTFIGNVVLSGEQPCLKHLKITASPLVLSKTLVSLAELLTPTTHTRSPRQPHLKVSQWNPQTSMTSATRAIH